VSEKAIEGAGRSGEAKKGKKKGSKSGQNQWSSGELKRESRRSGVRARSLFVWKRTT
jgi:hypothetical protein